MGQSRKWKARRRSGPGAAKADGIKKPRRRERRGEGKGEKGGSKERRACWRPGCKGQSRAGQGRRAEQAEGRKAEEGDTAGGKERKGEK